MRFPPVWKFSAVFLLTSSCLLVGCDMNETPDVDVTRDVEPVDPQADVELMPSGEADVELDPNTTP